ncbi:hypothetical protein [Halomonas alkalisoli]|uniref:hypothetical protein n=1 Tax=Halomonas alkalisoli TaxID=2907158 RepID=UPI001F2A664B|nr:hypothetical protein [Halomonas alkalisoli]MCE9684002.1 hypothetical protein [Halomonas alkalisoli]
MQTSSVSLYQSLLPGISNVTVRFRYYGLYAWLSSVYVRRPGATDDPKAWQRFIRRAEALYALTAAHDGEESGVAGITWAEKAYNAAEDEIAFADAAEPGGEGSKYLRQAWGAYGAAYASQLYVMDIYSEAELHDLPVPSEEVGEALAEAFESALGDVAPRFVAAIDRGSVTLGELADFAVMLPSGIETTSHERQLYEDALFCRLEGMSEEGVERRQTLQLVLEVALQLERRPSVGDIRWILYSGYVEEDTPLMVPGELEACRRAWWVYQLNDLSHAAFSMLFQCLLENLEGDPNGLPLGVLIANVIDKLRDEVDEWPSSWSEHLERTLPVDNAASPEPGAERRFSDDMMRRAKKGESCTPQAAWEALELLAVLHQRARRQRHDVEVCLDGPRVDVFRSVLSETRFLDGCLDEPFESTLWRLFEERIVQRHFWVALQKLRHQGEYTYRLEVDEGRVRARDPSGPAPTNPRLAPALDFLEDINLLDPEGVTADGMRCIEGLV